MNDHQKRIISFLSFPFLSFFTVHSNITTLKIIIYKIFNNKIIIIIIELKLKRDRQGWRRRRQEIVNEDDE